MHLLDELLEHLLGDGEVGDHAVLHRADGGDVARRLAPSICFPTCRPPGWFSWRSGRLRCGSPRRRFVEDDALAAHVDQGVGGAEVDGEIVGKIGAQRTNIGKNPGEGAGRWRWAGIGATESPMITYKPLSFKNFGKLPCHFSSTSPPHRQARPPNSPPANRTTAGQTERDFQPHRGRCRRSTRRRRAGWPIPGTRPAPARRPGHRNRPPRRLPGHGAADRGRAHLVPKVIE